MMLFGIKSSHFNDADGNPAGGGTFGRGFAITWQNGPLGRSGPDEERREPNGAFVEDIIAAAIDRLEYYQRSQFACDYNQQAIDFLKGAIGVLTERTKDRESRGVEGTHGQ